MNYSTCMNKKTILLSHIIDSKTPSYGNRDKVEIISNSSISKGETANTSEWNFSNNHIGTHIDSPHHFCQNGNRTFEIDPGDYFYKNIELIDIKCDEAKLISISDFEKIDNLNDKAELILIRTGYENFRNKDKYWNDNPGLDPNLALYLRNRFKDLRCVGFDFISLTSWAYRFEGRLSHKEFLCPEFGNSILIIEDMKLSEIKNPLDLVVVAPIMVSDGNGGPVTVYAINR